MWLSLLGNWIQKCQEENFEFTVIDMLKLIVVKTVVLFGQVNATCLIS